MIVRPDASFRMEDDSSARPAVETEGGVRSAFAKEKASPVAPECCLEWRQIGVRAGGESRA